MTALLLACCLATDPAGEVRPFRPDPGRELVYRGQRTEADAGSLPRAWTLEGRVFALDDGTVAFQSLARLDGGSPRVTLDVAAWDKANRPVWQSGLTAAADDWRPEPEVTFDLPVGPAEVGALWTVCAPGRPAITWQVEALETVQGVRCLKLVGRSQSANWEQLGTASAWHREDTVWLAGPTGRAVRLMSVVQKREPGQSRPNSRAETRLELESDLTYPGHLAAERGREIRQAIALAGQLDRAAARVGSVALTAIKVRVDWHLQNVPATPYRPAVETVQRRLDAVRRGETVPVVPRD